MFGFASQASRRYTCGMETIELSEIRDKVNGWIKDVHHTNIVETNDVVNMLLEINFLLSRVIEQEPVSA